MKLPGITYGRGVQTLGRENIRAPMRLAGLEAEKAKYAGADMALYGEAVAHIGAVVGDVVDQYSAHEADMALLKAEAELDERTAKRTQDLLTPTNALPDSVQSSIDTTFSTALPSGAVDTVDKPAVPWWQVGLESFDSDADSIHTAAMENLKTASAKQKFSDSWTRQVLSRRRHLSNKAMQDMKAQVRGETVAAFDQLVEAGRLPEAELLVLERVGAVFRPDEAQELIRAGRKTAEIAPIQAASAEGDWRVLESELARLRDPEYAGALSPKERVTAVKAVEGRLDSIESDLREQGALQRAKQTTALTMAVVKGQAGPVQIDQALDEQVITGAQHTALYKTWYKGLEDKRDEMNAVEAYARAKETGMPWDPTDKDDRKRADALYEKGGSTFATALELGMTTKVLPPAAVGKMVSMGLSDNPTHVEAASNFYRTVVDQGLSHSVTVDNKVLARLDIYAANRDAGMDGDESLKMANEAVQRTRNEATALTTQYSRQLASMDDDDKNSDWLLDKMVADDVMDTKIWGAPDRVPPQQGAEFESLVQQFYTYNGGRMELAREMAYRKIQAKWGGTQVNPEDVGVMRYPPERVLGLPPDLLQADLREFALEQGWDPDRTYVISDNETESDLANGWSVWTVDEDTGDWKLPLYSQGVPIRWKPTRKDLLAEERQDQVVKAERRRHFTRDVLELEKGLVGSENVLTEQADLVRGDLAELAVRMGRGVSAGAGRAAESATQVPGQVAAGARRAIENRPRMPGSRKPDEPPVSFTTGPQ